MRSFAWLVVVVLFSPTRSVACACQTEPPESFDDVFVGRFAYHCRLGDTLYYLTRVDGVVKGEVPSILLVASDSGSCGSFDLGPRYLVAGARDGPHSFLTSKCFGTRPAREGDVGRSASIPWWLVAPTALGVAILLLVVARLVFVLSRRRFRSVKLDSRVGPSL